MRNASRDWRKAPIHVRLRKWGTNYQDLEFEFLPGSDPGDHHLKYQGH